MPILYCRQSSCWDAVSYTHLDVYKRQGNPTWRLSPFACWYGAGNEFIYEDETSGKVAFADTTSQFYDYLKYANRLYREGFYPEENLAITNEDDAKQQAINGKCFIYEWNSRPTQLVQLNTATQANVEGAEWAAMPIPDEALSLIHI